MEHAGSSYLSVPGWIPDVDRWLVELNHEGYVGREIAYGKAGHPTRVTTPDEYGMWNNALSNLLPPGSPELAAFMVAFQATPLTREAFEAAWAEAWAWRSAGVERAPW